MSLPDDRLGAFLCAHGLATPDEPARWTPLTGGVSSEIWRVDLASGPVCVKRALPRLRVAQLWGAALAQRVRVEVAAVRRRA